jgi:hypothetical protein
VVGVALTWDDVISQCLQKQQEAFLVLLDRCEVYNGALMSSSYSTVVASAEPLSSIQMIQRVNFISEEDDSGGMVSFCGLGEHADANACNQQSSANMGKMSSVKSAAIEDFREIVVQEEKYDILLQKFRKGESVGERRVELPVSTTHQSDGESGSSKSSLYHLLPPRQHEPSEGIDSVIGYQRDSLSKPSRDLSHEAICEDLGDINELLQNFDYTNETQMAQSIQRFEIMIANAEKLWRSSVPTAICDDKEEHVLGPGPFSLSSIRSLEQLPDETTSMRSLQNRVEQLSTVLREIGVMFENVVSCHAELRRSTENSLNQMLEASRMSHLNLSKVQDEIIMATRDRDVARRFIDRMRTLIEKIEVMLLFNCMHLYFSHFVNLSTF